MPKRKRYVALDTTRGRGLLAKSLIAEAQERARKANEQLAIDYATAVGGNLGQMLSKDSLLASGISVTTRSWDGGSVVSIDLQLRGGLVAHAFVRSLMEAVR